MSAAFFARLKELEARVIVLEDDNKWLKDALMKVLAKDSCTGIEAVRTVQTARGPKAA